MAVKGKLSTFILQCKACVLQPGERTIESLDEIFYVRHDLVGSLLLVLSQL